MVPSTAYKTILVVSSFLESLLDVTTNSHCQPSWNFDKVMEICIAIIPFGNTQDHIEVLAWAGGI